MYAQLNKVPWNLLLPSSERHREQRIRMPSVELIDASALPEPAKTLLAHNRDMTSTLESFHEGTVVLRALHRHEEDGILERQVLLVLKSNGKVVEFGEIRIHLDTLPDGARQLVRGSHLPLGAILAHLEIEHECQPSVFVRLIADDAIQELLSMRGPDGLYGRRGRVTWPDGSVLAEVVEILPPAEDKGVKEENGE